MPIKPKEPKIQSGNWIASVLCGVYIIANVVWLNGDPFPSLLGFGVFGIVLPVILAAVSIWATKRNKINRLIAAVCSFVAVIFAAITWVLFFLIAIGTAQI